VSLTSWFPAPWTPDALAHAHDDADVAALAPASLAVIRSDAVDAAFPYRATWREERDRALAAARAADGGGGLR
jgi:hypothetical protein